MCIEVIIILHEHTLSVDEFNNPKVLKNSEAIATVLVRLLLLEPGTFETHPDMGVGIVSKYRYSFHGRADELRSDFQNQIEKYLPTFQGVKVQVSEIDDMYYLYAEIDGSLYGITINDDLDIKYTYKKLEELKS